MQPELSTTSSVSPCVLIMLHGVSGSGKSTLARWLQQETGTEWISSDIERKRLFGLKPEENSTAKGQDIYTPSASRRTFSHIRKLVKQRLEAKQSVILEATFLQSKHRKPFLDLAAQYQTPCIILSCNADAKVLYERVRKRKEYGQDPSEADETIVKAQLKQFRPIPVSEGLVVPIDTQRSFTEQQQLALDGIRQATNL